MAQAPAIVVHLVPDPSSTGEEFEDFARSLVAEIRELPVRSAEFADDSSNPSNYAKSAGLLSHAAILVTAIPSASLAGALLSTLARRLASPKLRSIKITTSTGSIEVMDASPHQQDLLIDAWLRDTHKNG